MQTGTPFTPILTLQGSITSLPRALKFLVMPLITTEKNWNSVLREKIALRTEVLEMG